MSTSATRAFLDKIAAKKKPKPEATAAQAHVVTAEPPPQSAAINPVPRAKPAPKVTAKAQSLSPRETWLMSAASLLRENTALARSPEFRVSVGYPQGQRGTDKLKGQTVQGEKTTDGIPQVFITPVCANTFNVLCILATELCKVHAGQNEGVFFETACRVIGLVATGNGSTSKTPAFLPDPTLTKTFQTIIGTLGEYPHAAINPNAFEKQETRQIKVHCQASGPTGYKARIAQSWLTTHGAPICPCHNLRMVQEPRKAK